jgi:3-deoxy-D-manno-octulosonate 8-phosphate phosphatase (KDO 8-P phosphatase)
VDDINLEKIKLMATDVDGTLTDGGMYYNSDGTTFKRFSVRDGLAVRLLKEAGITVAFISSDNSPVIVRRASDLGVEHCHTGIVDKVETLGAICGSTGLELENAAYMGDDLQDYAVMQQVGFSIAVGDAHPLIKSMAHHVCAREGGDGAFREAAEHIMQQQGHDILTIWAEYLGERSRRKG